MDFGFEHDLSCNMMKRMMFALVPVSLGPQVSQRRSVAQ